MSHPQTLEGCVALVTGASSGLGAATALALAQAGADVALVGRSQTGLDATAGLIKAAGRRASCHAIDLMDAGAGARAVSEAVSHHRHLDILVNNAALYQPGDIGADTSPDGWVAMFRVNVMALLEACQAAIAHMRSTGRPGHIVNIGSLATRLEGGGVYGATKAAVDYITGQLRFELERDAIRAVSIVPGAFPTQLGRSFTPEQLAALMKAFTAFESVPDADGRTAIVGVPRDIADAVVYAVSQPIHINIAEMVVRPAANTNPSAFD